MPESKKCELLNTQQIVNIIPNHLFPVSYPMHWHKHIEIICVPENTLTAAPPVLEVSGQCYDLYPGEILFLWPGELHQIIDNHSHQLVGIQFPADLLTELSDFAPFLNSYRSYRHISLGEETELAAHLLSDIRQLLQLNENGGSFAQTKMVIALYELFIHFAGHLSPITRMNDEKANKCSEKIQAACLYIQEHCNDHMTLESVADHIGFSACYFSRLFKQITDYTFVDYLNLQRVKKASHLLSDSPLNITEISFQSGFKSISSFNRVFHQFKGCSPRDYRRCYSADVH